MFVMSLTLSDLGIMFIAYCITVLVWVIREVWKPEDMRIWTRLEIERQLYTQQKQKVNSLIQKAKCRYYSDLFIVQRQAP